MTTPDARQAGATAPVERLMVASAASYNVSASAMGLPADTG